MQALALDETTNGLNTGDGLANDLSKSEEAWRYHRRGWNNAQIGRKLGVTREHVRNLLRKQREIAANELTAEQPIGIVADELAQIDTQLERCAQFLEVLYSQGTLDPATGLKVYTAKQREGIQAQERLVDKIRERKITLLLDVGIVPRAPERRELFSVLKRLDTEPNRTLRKERTLDQMKSDMAEILKYTPSFNEQKAPENE